MAELRLAGRYPTLKKMNRKRLKYSGIIVIGIFLIGFLYYFLFVNDFGTVDFSAWEQKYTEIPFDNEIWKADKENRFIMSKDLIDSGILIGKNLNEVTELLGDEYDSYSENTISYYLGFIPSPGNLDPDLLELTFENDKVIKIRQHGT